MARSIQSVSGTASVTALTLSLSRARSADDVERSALRGRGDDLVAGGYTESVRDDAGLMHVGTRYYDAQVGRFITRDSVLSEHPYLYCEHDPVNAVDPSGHGRLWEYLKDGAVVVGSAIGSYLGGRGDTTGVGAAKGAASTGVIAATIL